MFYCKIRHLQSNDKGVAMRSIQALQVTALEENGITCVQGVHYGLRFLGRRWVFYGSHGSSAQATYWFWKGLRGDGGFLTNNAKLYDQKS